MSDRARKHLQSQFQRTQSPDFTLNSVHQNLERRYLFNPFWRSTSVFILYLAVTPRLSLQQSGESSRLIRAPQDKTWKLQARFLQGKTKTKRSDINNLLLTLIDIVHHLHDLPIPTSVMHLQVSLHLSLPPKSSTRILLYSLGQQILSLIMFTERSTKILVRTTTPTFAHRVNLITWFSVDLVFPLSARNTRLVHLFLGTSPSRWLPPARMVSSF